MLLNFEDSIDETLSFYTLPLQHNLVAWIIPKDAISSCFSTQGITWMPHKFPPPHDFFGQ